MIDDLRNDERFRDPEWARIKSSNGRTQLSEWEKGEIISELESIDDPEERKRAILRIPDPTFQRDMIAVYVRLFRPLPEEEPEPEFEDGTAYIARKLRDGSTVYEPMTGEEWRRAKRESILAIEDDKARLKAIAENVGLFRKR